jgi:NADH-quinone oxidoreductase subunit K
MLILNINYILNITCIIFFSGLIGIILNRKNILITIMSIELLLLSINLNFVIFSIYLDDIVGQIFIFFVLMVAALESALGLSIITVLYRLKNNIEFVPIKKIYENKKI